VASWHVPPKPVEFFVVVLRVAIKKPKNNKRTGQTDEVNLTNLKPRTN